MIAFVRCETNGCEERRRDFQAESEEAFIKQAHAEGWTNEGSKWTCPRCGADTDTESEHIEYVMPNLSTGDGVLLVPRGMTAADWDDIEDRVKALRTLHGAK